MSCKTDCRATVFEIERFALNDGPGIRSVVFFKGCPLRCRWCSNPESQSPGPELFYRPRTCLACGRCVEVCPQGALRLRATLEIYRELCNACGQCVQACNTESLSLAGRELAVGEILQELLRDEIFYRNSGGGVTFSGGEPTAQPEALRVLAGLCRDRGLATCLETCGFFPWEAIEEALPALDLVLFDLKHLDSGRHQELTGAGNELVLANLRRLVEAGIEVVVRFPLIPGINDDPAHLGRLGDFLKGCAPGLRLDLLPYHRLGNSKYGGLGRPCPLEEVVPPTEEQLQAVKEFFERRGLAARIER